MEVIEELRGGDRPSLIVQELPEAKPFMWEEVGSRVFDKLLGAKNNAMFNLENKMKGNKEETFNIYNVDDLDAENYYGWSVTVTNEQTDLFQHTNFGVFMVNLTKGAMMGPHWNPISAEIAIVSHGQGMVHVICPKIINKTMCNNSRFKVEEGDVFVVPKFYPRVQISFNNESLVLIGFTIASKRNPSRYIAGKKSVLQTLDKTLLSKSFKVENKKILERIFSAQKESIILECLSCAKEEEELMEEEEAQRDKEAEIEEDMQRRWREAEEVAAKGGRATEQGGSYGL